MLLREAVPITGTTTAAGLHDALAEIGARLILRALVEDPPPVPQPADGATYAPKLTRDAGRIDWTRDAVAIERQVRAFDPWPGTFTILRGATLKVLAAAVVPGSGVPGTVLDDRLTIACGNGATAADPGAVGRPAGHGCGCVPARPSGAARYHGRACPNGIRISRGMRQNAAKLSPYPCGRGLGEGASRCSMH